MNAYNRINAQWANGTGDWANAFDWGQLGGVVDGVTKGAATIYSSGMFDNEARQKAKADEALRIQQALQSQQLQAQQATATAAAQMQKEVAMAKIQQEERLARMSAGQPQAKETAPTDDKKMPVWGWVAIGVGSLGVIAGLVYVFVIKKK